VLELMEICRSIKVGAVNPHLGAGNIRRLLAKAGYPPQADEFRVFVGLVSEIQDHPRHEAEYLADIVKQARAAAARHLAD
jgi:hypothetical protein